jgi:hypothetical protein
MTTTIQAAGYIVTDNEAICGVGQTADAAWADMLREMSAAGTDVLDDEDEISERMADTGAWTRASNFTVRPASAALLAQVKAAGGSIGWAYLGGVCITRAEEEEDA